MIGYYFPRVQFRSTLIVIMICVTLFFCSSCGEDSVAPVPTSATGESNLDYVSVYLQRLTSDPADSWGPCINTTPDSSIYVFWSDNRDGNNEIYVMRGDSVNLDSLEGDDSGLAWPDTVRITNASGDSWKPWASFDRDNNAEAVMWLDIRNGNIEVYSNYSVNRGVSWPHEDNATYDNYTSWYAPFAYDPVTATTYQVWEDWRQGKTEVYFRKQVSSGSWTTPVKLAGGDSYAMGPDVAAVPNSSCVVAVWSDDKSGVLNIYSRMSRDGGVTWDTTTCVAKMNRSCFDPHIAANLSGAVCVVWNESSAVSAGQYVSMRSAASAAHLAGPGLSMDMSMDIAPFYATSPDTAKSWGECGSLLSGAISRGYDPFVAKDCWGTEFIVAFSGVVDANNLEVFMRILEPAK